MSTKELGKNNIRKSLVLGIFSALLGSTLFGNLSLKAQDTQSTATDSASKSTKKKHSKKTASSDSTASAASTTATAATTEASSMKKKSRKSTAASTTEAAATQPAAAAAAPAPASVPKASSNTASRTPPPAGSGMVWVNTDTKVYHREGDRWYGKTKSGKYMTESDAIKAGYHLSGGKS